MQQSNTNNPQENQDPAQGIEIIADEPEYDFVVAPQWVLISPLKHGSARLYLILRAHINTVRATAGDTKVWPSQETLATMMGLSKASKILPYLKELIAYGLVACEKTRPNAMKERNIYRIRLKPPLNWEHPLSIQDIHRSVREDIHRQEGKPSKPKPRSPQNGKSPAQTVVPKTGLRSPQNGTPVVPKTGLELDELELDELPPPPTPSATTPANDPKDREEEEPRNLKTETLTDTEQRLLGLVPTSKPAPSRQQLKSLASRVDDILVVNKHRYGLSAEALFSHLAAGTSNADSVAAVWRSRLYDDALPVRRQSAAVSARQHGGVRWCGGCAAPGDRRVIDPWSGFLTHSCPACG